MNIRRVIILIGIIQVIFSSCNEPSSSIKKSVPNVILITVDDLGWKDLQFNGNLYIQTPNLDNFSLNGVFFSRAYSNAPNCSPTRASVLTGLYPVNHHIYTVKNSLGGARKTEDINHALIPPKNTIKLSSSYKTIAEYLKSEANYKSVHIGKWHLGEDKKGFFNSDNTGPIGQGFDLNIGGELAGYPVGGYFSPYKLKNLKNLPNKLNECLTDRLTDEAINFISKNHNNNFFINLSYYAVHMPKMAKPHLVDKYRKIIPSDYPLDPIYAAMVENTDWNIGRLLKSVQDLGIEENTLIIIYSDNGPYIYNNTTTVSPLKGGKGMIYEGGVRVPLIVSWKGNIEGNRTVDVPVSGIDILPTILDYAGVDYEQSKVDGISLKRLIKIPQDEQNEFKKRGIFFHFPVYMADFETKEYWIQKPVGCLIKGNLKLIQNFEDDSFELYNIEKDQSESINLIDSEPQFFELLKKELQIWQMENKAPIPVRIE